MDVELRKEYINTLAKLDEKDHLKFLLFAALEGEKVKEIGWERTLTAESINNILLLYMTEKNLSLRAKDGVLHFVKN